MEISLRNSHTSKKGLEVLRKGLILAIDQKDKSAARELKSAIENLED
jgi:hypothetical protein